MSTVTQKMKLVPEPLFSDKLRVKISDKGDVQPSKERLSFSGIPKMVYIISYTSTTFVPGKVTFETKRES